MEEKKQPDIPSNYVTLVQLQERWMKEKQRKQMEKEEAEERQKQMQQRKQKEKEEAEDKQKQLNRRANEEREGKIEGLGTEEAPAARRNSNGRRRGKSHDFKVSGPEKAEISVVAVVQDNETKGSDEKEVKSEELSGKKKKKKKKKSNNRKKKVERMGKDEATAEEGEGEAGSETQVAPVKLENENIPVRKYVRKSGMRMEFRPRINNVGRKSGMMKEIEVKIGNVVEKSDQMGNVDMVAKQSDQMGGIEGNIENVVVERDIIIDIERKFDGLSMETENDKPERQIRDISRRNREYRGLNSVAASRNREYRGYSSANVPYGGDYWRFNRSREYRGYNTGVFRGSGHYRGDYAKFNRSRKGKGECIGTVWVRKDGAADGGDVAGVQSLSVSVKESE